MPASVVEFETGGGNKRYQPVTHDHALVIESWRRYSHGTSHVVKAWATWRRKIDIELSMPGEKHYGAGTGYYTFIKEKPDTPRTYKSRARALRIAKRFDKAQLRELTKALEKSLTEVKD